MILSRKMSLKRARKQIIQDVEQIKDLELELGEARSELEAARQEAARQEQDAMRAQSAERTLEVVEAKLKNERRRLALYRQAIKLLIPAFKDEPRELATLVFRTCEDTFPAVVAEETNAECDRKLEEERRKNAQTTEELLPGRGEPLTTQQRLAAEKERLRHPSRQQTAHQRRIAPMKGKWVTPAGKEMTSEDLAAALTSQWTRTENTTTTPAAAGTAKLKITSVTPPAIVTMGTEEHPATEADVKKAVKHLKRKQVRFGPVNPVKRQRWLTDKGRAAIRAAQKRRWAKVKRSKK